MYKRVYKLDSLQKLFGDKDVDCIINLTIELHRNKQTGKGFSLKAIKLEVK